MISGGNPIGGSNPAGTGSGINYIGNHAYAHSGAIASDTSFTTNLNFSTGPTYIDSVIDLMGPVVEADPGDGTNSIFRIKYNDEIVAEVKINTNPEASPTMYKLNMIIPPYTKVVIDCKSTHTGQTTAIAVRGRVYA